MLEDLKLCKDRAALAKLLDIPVKELSFTLYKIPDAEKYTEICISKKSGGVRHIRAPHPKLKFLQRQLLGLLYECEIDIDRARGKAGKLHFGFRRHQNIRENAQRHHRRRHVFNLDIADYFDQFNFGRVRGFFIKSRDFGLDPAVATVIAQIACFENKLPQGSPCSPHIANLLTSFFDVRLNNFLRRLRCRYSRYCDDITISTDLKEFPARIAVPDASHRSGWRLSSDFESLFTRSSLPINQDKVRMSSCHSRQMVTGLVVNSYPNVTREFYDDTRVWCDRYFRTGALSYREFCEPFGDNCTEGEDDEESDPSGSKDPSRRLEGRLAHIAYAKRPIDLRNAITDFKNPMQYWLLIRRFAFFKNFVINRQPTIVTEGPSDVIYIREALKHRHHLAPSCYDATKGQYLVRFSPHSGLHAEALGLIGGAGNLSRFLDTYYARDKRMNLSLRTHPVVILLDNDSGCKSVLSRASQVHKIKLTTNDGVVEKKLQDNLYLLKTPMTTTKQETCIEDLLPASVLATQIDGKSFNPDGKTFDPSKHYGKMALAKYVAKNSAAISFHNFDRLVEGLERCVTKAAT